METLEQLPPPADTPESNARIPSPRIESQATNNIASGKKRIPFQIAAITLREDHPYSPTSSNSGRTTFTGLRIDDGAGSD